MNEYQYILTQNIMDYKFPTHFKHPTTEPIYFQKWIPDWDSMLSHLKGKPNVVGIEVGTNYGGFSTWCCSEVVTGEGSMLYTMDVNHNEYIENNLGLYKNVTFVKNLSENVLRELSHNGKKKYFADFILIDGNHFAKYVLEDAILAWQLLKYGGILTFDDYWWGVHTTDERVKPKLGIDAFLMAYEGHYEIIRSGWQVSLLKIKCKYKEEEISGNGNFLKNHPEEE